MNVLYVSNICSNKEFERIYNICDSKPLQSIQKFNKLLCEGMQINDGVNLEILTSAPVNRKMCRKIFWRSKYDVENEIRYNYCGMVNIPILKFISLFFTSIICTFSWLFRNRKQEKIIIYDAFCPIIANVASFLGNIFGVDIYGMYTDVPICMSDNLQNNTGLKNKLKSIYNKIEKQSNKIAKGYILLTEQMNEVVNFNNKPYIVVEGLADDKMAQMEKIENKYEEFTLLYAGGLYKKFGIENLVKAVQRIDSKNLKLILYGTGELEKELKMISSSDSRIDYRGSAPNSEVVEEEMKSTILVNPRFSNELYTRYSFPSKNMEYMSTGTPVLTTRLQGIPKEYDNYVFFIEDETVEGMKNTIMNLIKMNRNDLNNKGILAREFVLNNKNNKIQSKKILDFLKKYRRHK